MTTRRNIAINIMSYRTSPSILTLLNSVKERSLHFSELLKDRLYFATMSEVNLNFFLKKSDSTICFLHFDKELLYQPFNHDFGPLNLAMLYKFCKKINSCLQRNKIIIHLTTTNRFKRVNAAYLIGSYCIIYHHLLPGDVISRLQELSTGYVAYKTFTPFVDAGFDTSEHYLHLEDCFNAVYKASIMEILNLDKFNLNEYLFYEKVENGDLNWIIPGKFIAFCDPQTYSDSTNHYVKLYINYFRKNNITTIIRLNKSRYDPKLFTDKGFKHYNLAFMDGGVPSDYILREFLRISERHSGAIAVHCKAGLGRTGTLIACYLMKHMKFTALEAIAWVRICRPGSIVGYQQKWLIIKQKFLWNHQTGLLENNNINNDGNRSNNNDKNNENIQLLPITIVKCHILSWDGFIPNVTLLRQQQKSTISSIKVDVADHNNIIITSTNQHQINYGSGTTPRKNRQINLDIQNDDNNNNPNDSMELTQGDYLNQIKLNRKRQLRSKINHWFKTSSSSNKHSPNNNNDLDANNNNPNFCNEEWSSTNERNSADGDVSELKLYD